ncbi:MAG: RagB/SusD family nutrient uptake outer membrane protein [Muribaculaceae bacterium]|nr:RagB/SusD family nutrient uptake outer membrane protein [Muribaculaceae bacterium]
MKKIFLFFAAGLLLTSCSDLLDTEPYDKFTKQNYFTSETNVQLFANYFYNTFTGYGSGSGDYYFNNLNDDQGTTGIAKWTYTSVPASAASWNTPYTEIRRANTLIAAVPGIDAMSEASKNNWIGVGRLYRAWQHYKVVRNFGDCYWVDKELDSSDDDILYGARQPRNDVMDKVLEDLNFACANITMNDGSKVAFNKWVALAMKAEICLYEGCYSKYVANNSSRANTYLTEAKAACQQIMSSGKFSLNSDYKSNFDSENLANNPEMILYKHYVLGTMAHGTIDYTCGSTQVNGINKDAFDSYLFKDGKPLATTSMDKSDKGKIVNIIDNSGLFTDPQPYINMVDVFANRDPRLTAQVDTILQFVGCGYARFPGQASISAQSTSSTGYGVMLFDNVKYAGANNAQRQSTNGNYSDAPIFWYAEILLNYAEACAELGSCTQGDLDNSINKLRDRVGMPHLTTSVAADPANNMGVSNLIWEVRRERRVEMMFCMNDRYYSLQRWNQLSLLDTQKYPNLCRGAYVKGFDADGVDLSKVTIDADGYINCTNNGAPRIWDTKYNLFPIPSGQINLNPAMGQNPGW